MAMPSKTETRNVHKISKKLYVRNSYSTINYLKTFRLLKIKLLANCFYFKNYLI